MNWITIAIICYLLQAFVHLFDKMLLDNGIDNPKEYAFWVSAPLILALAFIPFVGFFLPSWPLIFLALVAGFIFNASLYWLYVGMQKFESTRIIPAVSGLLPVFSFAFVFIFWHQVPPLLHIWASLFLVAGTIVLNCRKEKLFSKQAIGLSVWTSFLLAVAFLLSKLAIDKIGSFATAFILIKLGGFLVAALLLLFSSEVRNAIFHRNESSHPRQARYLLFGNQFLAATGNVLQNYAIALAPMSLLGSVQALEGVKHGAMFILGWIFSIAIPTKFRENFSRQSVTIKFIGIALISCGLYLVSI